ncbi:MAG: hypothetical protein D6768_10995 [Chloroflexi bacterium]|nr:MAG: hypothetical protein D6768_10995 [Chloroflexota bacterium]
MLDYGMQIPLFPLNTVLFPGRLLPLHIFEERYKAMVKQCLDNYNSFGVVLAKTQKAVVSNVSNVYYDDLYTVGTTAQITAVENLENGRMNLIVVGQERFKIKNIWPSSQDFLVGKVDPFPMRDAHDSAGIDTRILRARVEQYVRYLDMASAEDLSNPDLPTDPKALAYLACGVMQSSLVDKQQLLAIDTLRELVTKTATIIDRENKILAYTFKAHQAHRQIKRLPFVDYSLN